jgi:hypothetical protein
MRDHTHRRQSRPDPARWDATEPDVTRPDDVVAPQIGRHARPDDIPVFGRAAVPVPPARPDTTDELPVVPAVYADRAPAVRPQPKISWRRPSRPWLRSLSDGWGFSGTGLLVLFCGWGIWAAAGRGQIAAPLVGLGIVVAVGVGVFALSRVIGRILLAGVLRRARPHARYAHFLTGLFLALAGVAYFGHTTGIADGLDWVREEIRGLWDNIPH